MSLYRKCHYKNGNVLQDLDTPCSRKRSLSKSASGRPCRRQVCMSWWCQLWEWTKQQSNFDQHSPTIMWICHEGYLRDMSWKKPWWSSPMFISIEMGWSCTAVLVLLGYRDHPSTSMPHEYWPPSKWHADPRIMNGRVHVILIIRMISIYIYIYMYIYIYYKYMYNCGLNFTYMIVWNYMNTYTYICMSVCIYIYTHILKLYVYTCIRYSN